jgi:hypothetical protein
MKNLNIVLLKNQFCFYSELRKHAEGLKWLGAYGKYELALKNYEHVASSYAKHRLLGIAIAVSMFVVMFLVATFLIIVIKHTDYYSNIFFKINHAGSFGKLEYFAITFYILLWFCICIWIPYGLVKKFYDLWREFQDTWVEKNWETSDFFTKVSLLSVKPSYLVGSAGDNINRTAPIHIREIAEKIVTGHIENYWRLSLSNSLPGSVESFLPDAQKKLIENMFDDFKSLNIFRRNENPKFLYDRLTEKINSAEMVENLIKQGQ